MQEGNGTENSSVKRDEKSMALVNFVAASKFKGREGKQK